jgi:2'-5' RNA ligase
MRLFVALDLTDEIRQRIARFMEGVREFAPEPRWVRPESLHVTLKFIGETKQMEEIHKALETVTAGGFDLSFRGTGFFPTARSARVFWIGIEADARLAKLAAAIDFALTLLGIEKESRAYSPHLTLARSGSGRPQRSGGDKTNRQFARLQEKLAARPAPDFGTMTAREFFLYQSKLAPGGAVYSKLARFALQ